MPIAPSRATGPAPSPSHATATPLVQRLRGTSGDVLLLEEAAFIDEQILYQVILPLLGVSGTALLAISTPNSDATNYYSRFFNLKDENGEGLFRTIKLGMACDDCVKSDKAAECTHRVGKLPVWKPAGRQHRLKTMMSDNPELFAQEMLAQVISSKANVFHSAWVDALQNRHLWKSSQTYTPDFGFLAIDPSGGGGSDMAIVSGFFGKHGELVVSAISTRRTRCRFRPPDRGAPTASCLGR
jgi:hypothetical protein